MNAVALVSSSAMAAVLLAAAVQKLWNREALPSTLRALGFPERFARPVATLVIAAEIALAFALVFRPDAAATQTGVVALAAVFALAGLAAIRSGDTIPCSCFGEGGGRLGRRQLVALLPWLGGVTLLRFSEPLPPASGAALLAVAALVVAAMRGVQVWKVWQQARGDRRSAEETYTWLPSH